MKIQKDEKIKIRISTDKQYILLNNIENKCFRFNSIFAFSLLVIWIILFVIMVNIKHSNKQL